MSRPLYRVQETVSVDPDSFHSGFAQIEEVKPFMVGNEYTYIYRLFGEFWFFESELKPYKKASKRG